MSLIPAYSEQIFGINSDSGTTQNAAKSKFPAELVFVFRGFNLFWGGTIGHPTDGSLVCSTACPAFPMLLPPTVTLPIRAGIKMTAHSDEELTKSKH